VRRLDLTVMIQWYFARLDFDEGRGGADDGEAGLGTESARRVVASARACRGWWAMVSLRR
jgi:hypothetical protein